MKGNKEPLLSGYPTLQGGNDSDYSGNDPSPTPKGFVGSQRQTISQRSSASARTPTSPKNSPSKQS